MNNRQYYIVFLILFFGCSTYQAGETTNTATLFEESTTNSRNTTINTQQVFGIFTAFPSQNKTVLNGDITSRSYKDFDTMLSKYPTINLIELEYSDGTNDDITNLKICRRLNDLGMATHLLPNAEIASGAVDLFLSGVKRTGTYNNKIGVHAWSSGRVEATDFREGHDEHLAYIKFYVTLGYTPQWSSDFYYYTIYAAPASAIHYMTPEEIVYYNVFTE